MDILEIDSQHIRLGKIYIGDPDFRKTLEILLKENGLIKFGEQSADAVVLLSNGGRIYSGKNIELLAINTAQHYKDNGEYYKVDLEKHTLIAYGENSPTVLKKIENYCIQKNTELSQALMDIDINERAFHHEVFQLTPFLVRKYP